MYIATHRVVRGDQEGVNGFIHSHEGMTWPSDPESLLQLREADPGKLVGQRLGLEPVGGNRVRCYLDFLAPDGRMDVVDRLISELRSQLNEAPPLVVHVDSGVALFGCEFGGLDARYEWFDELVECARQLQDGTP